MIGIRFKVNPTNKLRRHSRAKSRAGSAPLRPDGTVRLNPAALEASHGSQVKEALAGGPIAG
jgi:hypothetical protein